MKTPVRVQFWGTRGGLAKPGRHTVRYGGNTACVQVTSPDGALVIVDCGTGAHDLGRHLLAEAQGPLRGSILISHTHWDHIQGFPFFAPLFVRGGEWDIYGPSGLGRSLRDSLSGQMEHTYFPVALNDMGATIRFHDLVEGSFEIGDIRITARYLNHPALTLGYRLETGGRCVVYACDHEPYARVPGEPAPLHESDRRHSEFLTGADLVIHDSQFTDEEYARHKGWGHSPVEYVCEMGELAGARRMALTHHDAARTDDALDRFVEGARAELRARGSSLQIFAAADGQIVELAAAGHPAPDLPGDEASALPAVAPALKEASAIIGISEAKLARVLLDAACAENVRTSHLLDEASILHVARSAPPTLIFLEDGAAGIDGLRVCRALRADGDPRLQTVPIVILADRERSEEGATAGITQWLLEPFTVQYARAQIQKWLLRSAGRWIPAEAPADEAERLAVLRDLSLLDTPREDRFDRITRLAAALGEVPIALVTLVDHERQWFKSCFGLSVSETSRDVSFCAHAIASRRPVIVCDALLDDRFADNPLVVGEPRIRFYAGFPVFHARGACLGTLCFIDTRPRQFSAETIRHCEDLAGLVQREINSASA